MSRLAGCLLALLSVVLAGAAFSVPARAADLPLPEHPRPDFERAQWVNLNGRWGFRFDPDDAGERNRWFESDPGEYPLGIRVPFPWEQRLVLRVDDAPHPFKLEGKQGYGPARGLWQTVYLEARPALFVESFELHPDLAGERLEDEGWHPGGFTTWPSDHAMREEILIARRLGLNAIRTHVKVELPRKLYWADRLGVLVMADVPNSWGEPDAAMREEWEAAFRGMVRRDFNHPSIFSWVLFNEQWGLLSREPGPPERKAYLPETQEWVASRVDVAKMLDPTRFVEDNSPCCGSGHVRTDLNSWHR